MISPCTFLKKIFATVFTNVFFLKFPYNIHIWHFSMPVLCSAHQQTCLHYPIGKVETYQSESLVLGWLKDISEKQYMNSCVKFHKLKDWQAVSPGLPLPSDVCARCDFVLQRNKSKSVCQDWPRHRQQPSVSRFFPNIAFWGQHPTAHILIFSTTCPVPTLPSHSSMRLARIRLQTCSCSCTATV